MFRAITIACYPSSQLLPSAFLSPRFRTSSSKSTSSPPPPPQSSPLLITRHTLDGFPAIEHKDGVIVELALNRPEARNALNKSLVSELHEAIASLGQDSTARVVVIKSTSPTSAFCAGADLKERTSMSVTEVSSFVSSLRALMDGVENLPIPTVAVIEGAAFGGGLELALACDLRVAGPKAQMGLTETSLAIIPGAGGTQRLPRVVGEAKAKELIFRAVRIGAREAWRVGLVNVLMEGDGRGGGEEVGRICREMASNGPVAVRAAKKAVREGMQVDLRTGLELERECYATVIPTEDRIEGLRAFKEKRKPVYNGR
ncbi:hypothetical protein VYU27_006192 [Nannochloropsis oceanica]